MVSSDVQYEFESTDKTLRSLAQELKHPLCIIARQAEAGGEASLDSIQRVAEHSLALIDSYLLTAQTEYGQIALDLTPMGLGSVFHDVSHRLRPLAAVKVSRVVVDNRACQPVMTHRLALTSILVALADIVMHRDSETPELILRSYKTNKGSIGVGVFSKQNITSQDLRRALQLQGRAQMPMAKLSNRSGVSLAIADGLCRAIGGSLEVKKMGKLTGLATVLPKSDQLVLV